VILCKENKTELGLDLIWKEKICKGFMFKCEGFIDLKTGGDKD
jgi:hypothetical protein